jgi:glucokinase
MPFIVFSGLPGSGKSSAARQLAPRFDLPLLDKDDFLDALFDERGEGDATWRSALSRDADERLIAATHAVAGACIVSWWRRPQIDRTSGTPTEWLVTLPVPVIEIHCHCDVDLAVTRFLHRRRHPGHLDETRSLAALRAQFTAFAALGALGCGRVVELDTNGPIQIDALVDAVHRLGSITQAPNER